MISESKSSKTDLRSANIILCPKCDCKTQEIDKFYDREIKNLHYLLNFKDLAVRKRDEMILIYIEDINKLKETIKNLNKLVYRLKLQIPDPKNLNKFPNTNNTPYVDTFENDYPGISKLNYNERPISSISENKKRVFSASILKKNQLNPIVKIISKKNNIFLKYSFFSLIESKDKNICVTATQGLPLQQSLLNDNNKKITIMMENDEKKVLKDPKLKQLEDFYLKNESPLETFNTYKNFAKNEFFDISFSILRDFKTTISQSLKLKKMIKYFQKVIKTLNYQENFYIISKHTADIMECEKVFL